MGWLQLLLYFRRSENLLGLGRGFFGRGKQATVADVQDTPRSKISSAPQGLVEVEGFAWPESDVDLTLSGLEAVYRSLILQREDTEYVDKKRKKVWRTVGSYSTGRPFYIVDETGLALVEMSGIELNVASARYTAWRSLTQDQQSQVMRVISGAIQGFPPSNFLFGLFAKKFRVIESEVLLGSPLYVRGAFRTPEGSDHKIQSPGLTKFCQRVFDLQGRNRKKLDAWIDTNKDGKVSETELRKFYSEAARVERMKARNSGEAEMEFGVHGLFETNDMHRLLVADTHEKLLVTRMRIQGLKRIAVAAGIVAFFGAKYLGMIEPKPRHQQAVVNTPKRSIASLHEACISGDALVCEKLLSQPNMPQANSEYYRSRACNLGLKQYCK